MLDRLLHHLTLARLTLARIQGESYRFKQGMDETKRPVEYVSGAARDQREYGTALPGSDGLTVLIDLHGQIAYLR
jgi:hypothetical protein